MRKILTATLAASALPSPAAAGALTAHPDLRCLGHGPQDLLGPLQIRCAFGNLHAGLRRAGCEHHGQRQGHQGHDLTVALNGGNDRRAAPSRSA